MRLTHAAVTVTMTAVVFACASITVAQTVRDADVIERLGMKEAGKSGPLSTANHSKLTPEQALRIRILEVESGERAFANRVPDSEIIVGPPLNEREQIVHVMNRMAFGPKSGQVDEMLKQGGWVSWVEQQLDPESLTDSKLDSLLAERFPWTKMSLQQIYQKYPLPENAENQPQLRRELRESIVVRAALSEKQFKEVMCEFWRNHLCIDQPEGNAPRRSWSACHYEENVIRKHAFGKWPEMLMASATHAGMLEYLDNYVSRKGAWNENYARELMELHTLGADRYYNEQDVLELSLTLTGWTYNDNMGFMFRSNWHDDNAHKVLGQKMPGGEEGGKFAVQMLAHHPGTARFLSEKLCRYLVNDNPPKSLVTKATNTFRASKGDLKKVYREIVLSEEFMSRLNYKAKFKTPFEFTISALRAVNANPADAVSTTDNLVAMGQDIYGCFDPTGYYDHAEAWLDAGVLTRRWNYALAMVSGRVKGVTVDAAIFDKYKGENTAATKAKLLADLIGGDIGDAEHKVLDKLIESGNIARAVGLVMGSPSFQQQ